MNIGHVCECGCSFSRHYLEHDYQPGLLNYTARSHCLEPGCPCKRFSLENPMVTLNNSPAMRRFNSRSGSDE